MHINTNIITNNNNIAIKIIKIMATNKVGGRKGGERGEEREGEIKITASQ